MNQVFNPYLPLFEYVPDGEPRVFDNRIYIYGSHDFAGGMDYCMGDYVTWSAPVDDLTKWKYEGVIYRRTQDPTNKDNKLDLWAPDVVRGPDGKYYLYYCFNFVPEIGVAVSDSPVGPFEFYGHVKYPDHIMNGKELNEHLPFDPAVLVDDDGRVFLYYGFSPLRPMAQPEDIKAMGLSEEEEKELIAKMTRIGKSDGGMVVELEQDMITMKAEPQMCIPGGLLEEGTGFEGHGYFEASSMRKVNGKYYYVYSSKLSHELCYAVSEYPDHGFRFGGTIISNGDIGYKGNQKPLNMMGNNHGGMIEVNGQWYIFYHRHTHGTESSRQGCAEKIEISENGHIEQVEMTSCGLNKSPLKGEGKYPAAIACNLITEANEKKITFGESTKEVLPYIYEEKVDDDEKNSIHYIANISGTVKTGYKYFDFAGLKKILLTVRGEAKGKVTVSLDRAGEVNIGETEFVSVADWSVIEIPVKLTDGVHSLYFNFNVDGAVQFNEFELL